MPWLHVALVRAPQASLDAIVAHEVGHLLGAHDHTDETGIMSPWWGQAYADGQLSITSWCEMGGAEPDHVVLVPEVRR